MYTLITRDQAKREGLIKYFTGKPCKHGHIGERKTCNGGCIDCTRIAPKTDQRKIAIAKGLPYYFTGKICRNGHLSKRNTGNGICLECYSEAEYFIKNRESLSAKHRIYRRANPHIGRSANARRRAREINATPKWADKTQILKIYREAVSLGMEVDHIIPLTHKLVCGLHVQQNLQLLTKQDNVRKSAKFNPSEFEFGKHLQKQSS